MIGNAIVDFVCPKANLIVELDGGQHDQHQPAANPRTKRLNQHGYRVLRFWNNEVIKQPRRRPPNHPTSPKDLNHRQINRSLHETQETAR